MVSKLHSISLSLMFVLVAIAHGEDLLGVKSFRNQNLEKYPALGRLVENEWTVPGLAAGFVPQGISFVPGTGVVLLSGYQRLPRFKQRSVVTLVEYASGLPVRTAILHDLNGKPLSIHAGGVAVLGNKIWIPARFRLYRFRLDDILSAQSPQVSLHPDGDPIEVDSMGSFITATENEILVGDFVTSSTDKYNAPAHHASPASNSAHSAWIAAYRINTTTGLPEATNRYDVVFDGETASVLRPDYVIHHRQKVQGAVITPDGCLVLSVSYGDSDSVLAVYRPVGLFSPENAVDRTRLPDGSIISSWTLSEENWMRTLSAPPGSEGFALQGDHFAVVFEGGADPYRKWETKEDRVLFLSVPGFLTDLQK